MNRRHFLGATAGSFALANYGQATNAKQPALPLAGPRVVGIHDWVFSSDKPNYDCFPILDQVFDDVKYAGFDAIELMEVSLRHNDSVPKIGDLIQKTGVGRPTGNRCGTNRNRPKLLTMRGW